MNKFLISILFLAISLISFSQDELTLAQKYYQAKEYEKSADLFWKLYQKRKSKYYFQYYLQSLINLDQIDKALKITKKEVKKNKNDVSYHIELGYLYQLKNQQKEAEKEFNYVIKNLPYDRNQIVNIANNFIRYRKYDYAEKTYLTAQEKTYYKFYKELGTLYGIQKKYDLFVDNYLTLLENDPTQMKFVKSQFSYYLKNDINNEFSDVLEKKLILKTQKSSDLIFYELLLWFYLEKGNYFSAYLQARAIDVKQKNGGKKTYEVAIAALQADDYETATEAFNFIIQNPSNRFYFKAKLGLLKIEYKKIEKGIITDTNQIRQLEQKYLTLINQRNFDNLSFELIIDLAHLQTFYLRKYDAAINILKNTLNKPLNTEQRAEILLELGKTYLCANKLWTAILTFAKVEENYKKTKYSENASFLKAMTYFYLGNFQWAKDQFEVLKGSTSKLISNDAIYMDYIINENLDTTETAIRAMNKFAKAKLYFFAKKYDESLKILDTLLNAQIPPTLYDDIYYLKYEIYYNKNDFEKAAEQLQKIVDNYPYEFLSDKAVFMLALLYKNHLNDKQKAMELLKKLLFEYKTSFYLDKAREIYRNLLNS